MSYQLCIDIGGTFTDCLVADPDGTVSIFKSPTTPGEFEKGFINVLHVAAEGYGFPFAEFINQVDLIVHGSTVSTNALVERKTVKIGVLLNEGHEDVLVLREGPRKGVFEWRLDYPEPYVPKRYTRGIGGRIIASGAAIEPLREEDVAAAVADFKKQHVQAIAVGLLWSVVNPAHELRVEEIIQREWPGIPVTLSHNINPVSREYKRIISAVIDASIKPIIASYIGKLQQALDEAGYQGELLLANCVGGMMPPAEMMRKPIFSVMSGPTLAPMAARALSDEADIIVGDMGGTTFDVSAIRDRQIIVTPDSMINDDALGIPKVDVRSVGAGGGSIAFVDEGGLLHVGPHSAGARPGPACYGLGGDKPTVTDANLVLGIIDPDYFLGGKMKLDKSAAERAIQTIADSLGVSLHEAAYAIFTTSNHNMVAAIEEITIREGINPRDSFFVCGGGATAIHIADMADILGLKRYMIPRFMAGLSAFGGLISDLRREEMGVNLVSSHQFDYHSVNELNATLLANGHAFLEQAGISLENRYFEFSFLGRYEYQSWEIEVAYVMPEGGLTPSQLPALCDAFHKMHKRIYSISSPDEVVEFTAWKIRAIGKRAKQDVWKEYVLPDQSGPVVEKKRRAMYLHEAKTTVPVPVYNSAELGFGARVTGPCLIETATFTAWLKARHTCTPDRQGNLIVTVE
ncbi:hydantoinase/oxoprolinase family protein [Brenneria goodwinii]|uniref:N-methylhydantoinase A n=1 Tax=Brenneria goodwinii TaxID=1109412 RepID=A0A0G4JQF1_9GAMM|nr:hydantoinase/oxoprolinase family protein [Brenneria goodwinii]MCG8155517.1 hydantoinase/oxoprolinase family protein [Brenneria goodwinii]MCG8160456.1 hydantoinase/oxoprolinase family protein [Brenneria goodwinii]MCG8164979.1 hydantoinase/oxoprolinase family protein [Brenneria goodwinii]MCG8169364.1 hydantoinase/oxoprolinase family protein [Brenneria goodwinii]MCG8174538.1 hydantoinase/oxoprolinase family protein [Brenneria goodwinii]